MIRFTLDTMWLQTYWHENIWTLPSELHTLRILGAQSRITLLIDRVATRDLAQSLYLFAQTTFDSIVMWHWYGWYGTEAWDQSVIQRRHALSNSIMWILMTDTVNHATPEDRKWGSGRMTGIIQTIRSQGHVSYFKVKVWDTSGGVCTPSVLDSLYMISAKQDKAPSRLGRLKTQ